MHKISKVSIARAFALLIGSLFCLHVFTGTAEAMRLKMVKDIFPGDRDSINLSSKPPTVSNGILYFSANDQINGPKLWRSDGTEAGTYFLDGDAGGAFSPSFITDVEGTIFFRAEDSTNGFELWKSDGTDNGTVLVKDIQAGVDSSSPENLANINGILFFSADDGVNGFELWKSDGTEAGTILVKDIRPGDDILGRPFSSSPSNLTNVNGTLYFTAQDNAHGLELWKSDGTEAGTVLVKDILPGSSPSIPDDLTAVNNTLFFSASDGVNGEELWKSDGTEAGTVLVKDIWIGNSGSGPRELIDWNGTLFFHATDNVSGSELWKSDGTTAGTVLVKELLPIFTSLFPLELTIFKDTLFFSGDERTTARELWKTDGTDAGTVLVKDIHTGTTPSTGNPESSDLEDFEAVEGKMYFRASDVLTFLELWETDGTEEGTKLVIDLNLTPGECSCPFNLTNVNGVLFFWATDGIHGYELWTLDNRAFLNDLDDDQNSDLLLVHDSGLVAKGLLDDSILQNPEQLLQINTTSSGWTVISTGDFNNDNKADLLLYNAGRGEVRLFLLDVPPPMNDKVIVDLDSTPGLVPQGAGDFNGDGRDEILVYGPTSGFIGMIFLDESGSPTSFEAVNMSVDVANDWALVNTGDFNRDGKTDLLLYNTVSGTIGFFQMDGATVTAGVALFTLDPATGWGVEETGDFNGDGNTDILILHTSGAIGILTLENGVLVAFHSLGSVPADNVIINAGRYDDADNKDDLLIQNVVTGEIQTAIQDGAVISSFNSVVTLDPASGWTVHSGKP